MTAPYERFSHQLSFSDTTSDVSVEQQLFDYLKQWKIDNPSYRVQDTTTQWDIVRYPRGGGGAYGEIIWYAQAV